MNFDAAIAKLDALGNWSGITEYAETHFPALLEKVREATCEVNRHPTPATIQKYFDAWRELFGRCNER